MAELTTSLPELHKKDEIDDPIARLLQFKPEPSQDATKIVVPVPVIAAPAPVPVIVAPAPVPVIAAPAPVPVIAAPTALAPVIAAPAPVPVIAAPAPVPIITAPAPTPVIAAPAPAPVIGLSHAPAMPFRHNLPLAPIAPILPNQPIHAPEVPVVHSEFRVSIKSHRNIGMHWHEPGQEFNVNSLSGSAAEVKKFLSALKGFDLGLFDQFEKDTEKSKNIGPLFEGKGQATMVYLTKC